jgi:hypothetical protein
MSDEEKLREHFEEFVRSSYNYSLDRFTSPAPMAGVYGDQLVKAMWAAYRAGHHRGSTGKVLPDVTTPLPSNPKKYSYFALEGSSVQLGSIIQSGWTSTTWEVVEIDGDRIVISPIKLLERLGISRKSIEKDEYRLIADRASDL